MEVGNAASTLYFVSIILERSRLYPPSWRGRSVNDVEANYQQLEHQLMCAMRDADAVALDLLLTDTFVITTAGWLREPATKQTWIEALSQHSLTGFVIHDVAVRGYGPVSVALVHSTQSGSFRGGAYTHEFRYTDVWRLQGEKDWKLDVRHATLLPATN